MRDTARAFRVSVKGYVHQRATATYPLALPMSQPIGVAVTPSGSETVTAAARDAALKVERECRRVSTVDERRACSAAARRRRRIVQLAAIAQTDAIPNSAIIIDAIAVDSLVCCSSVADDDDCVVVCIGEVDSETSVCTDDDDDICVVIRARVDEDDIDEDVSNCGNDVVDDTEVV